MRLVAAAALAVLTLTAGASAAASLVLDEAAQRDALAYGRRTATRDGFDAEWKVTNGAGEVARVMTPFHRLAIAARHAALRDQPLRSNEPAKLLRAHKDRLVLWVELRGRQQEFAHYLVPELMVGERRIKAAFVQNERSPVRLDDGIYLARCVYAFPTKELAGASRVTLVVRDGDGRETSRFGIDLGRMR